jgi:hypothetical protein
LTGYDAIVLGLGVAWTPGRATAGKQLTKDNNRRTPAAKLKPTAAKKSAASKATKLKSSRWYESAIRSISISKGKPQEKRDKVTE